MTKKIIFVTLCLIICAVLCCACFDVNDNDDYDGVTIIPGDNNGNNNDSSTETPDSPSDDNNDDNNNSNNNVPNNPGDDAEDETPSEPNQPSEPENPSEPNQPSEPENPDVPSEPEYPSEPSEPSEPENPGENEDQDKEPVTIITPSDKTYTVVGGKIDLGYGDYVTLASGTNGDLAALYKELKAKVKTTYDEIYVSNYEKGALSLFDINNSVKIKVSISEEELRKMNTDHQNGNKESYRICNLDVTVCGLTFHFEQVGIRQKGNTSRGEILDGNGNLNQRHYKFSFSETFDDDYTTTPIEWNDEDALAHREDRTFFGLEKFDMRWNRNQESTYIREYYAFETYRNNGLLAPHSNPIHLNMSIDGDNQNMGVYLLVEDVNKDFLKRNLSDDYYGGDMYKLGWVGGDGASFDSTASYLFGVEDQGSNGDGTFYPIPYVYDLKTNKKKSNHEDILAFINGINTTSTNDFYSFLQNNSIYEYVIKYFAISYLLGDPDDLRGNFNNGYVYFTPDGKAMFIPIDHDRALGSTGGTGNPTNHHGAYNNPHDSRTGYSENNKPLFTKTILENGNQNIKNDYLKAIQKVIDNGWLNIEKFTEYYNIARSHYDNCLTLGNRVNGSLPSFSLNEADNPSDSWNLSIAVYLNAKKNTFNNFMGNNGGGEDEDTNGGNDNGGGNGEDTNGSQNTESTKLYIRGTFNDWNGISDEYKLSYNNGVYTLTITLNAGDEFKIATHDWSTEYNFNNVTSYPDGAFVSAGERVKIKTLISGTYVITITNNQLTITVA